MNLSTLNPEQRQAVQTVDGPLLLLAGAGSGKTRVITSRIAYLVDRCNVSPEAILAVTFTNKAAREMQQRVAEQVGQNAAQAMVISTFHALAVRLLKADIQRLGYKRNFSIYDTADQTRLVRDLLQDLLPPGAKADPAPVLWAISAAKNRMVGPQDFSPQPGHEVSQWAASIYPQYQRRLKAHNAVDFDDLLMLAVRLLQEHPEVCQRYRERFRYIMVDEYQDTNAVQYRLLRLLADGHRNLCVVGDDDQSIYGWRGADLGNILQFEQDFPGTRVVKLEQNYRSTGTILSAANAVIQNNAVRKPKKLWSADGAGELIDLLQVETDEDEARTVVERIHAERFRNKRRYRDFAILYRTNAQSRPFEEQLRYENIPYVLIGGQQFFDRKEVKDVLSYLRLLLNPRDEVSLLRVLNYPRRGIGDSTAEKLIALSVERNKGLWSILQHIGVAEGVPHKAKEAITGFVQLIERFRARMAEPANLVSGLRQLVAEIRLTDQIYTDIKDAATAKRRVENVEEVFNAMASYVQRTAAPTLAGFLERVSLLEESTTDEDDKDKKLNEDAVTLMSLHSSKGLEFPVVHLVGVEEELLPHGKSGTDIEEERRLCYVGLTRAQQKLTLTHCRQRKYRGQLEPRLPSRFLKEIPDELMVRGAQAAATEEEKDAMASNFFAGLNSLFGDDE